jgi:TRAP-type C4-dicarboxylate transport system substrate-binding protein
LASRGVGGISGVLLGVRPATAFADLQRKLVAEADVKLLAEFKANPDVVVNEPDRAPFQAATAGVIEKYKSESYGDFVAEVLAAAGAA